MIGIRRKGSWRGHRDDARRRDRRCWSGRHVSRGPARRRPPGLGGHALRAVEPDRRPASVGAGRWPCPPDRARRHALPHEPSTRPVGRHRARHPDPTVRSARRAGALVPPRTDRRRPERSHGGRRVRPCRRTSAAVRRSTSPWRPSSASCPGPGTSLAADWPSTRATVAYLDRPITDWSLEDALATIRSPEGHQFIRDAFGYDSGFNPHNAGDAIQYLLGGNDPSTRGAGCRSRAWTGSRVPSPTRFEERGGTIELGKDVRRVAMDDGVVRLEFADGGAIRARRLVLAIPIPALAALADASPVLGGPAWRRLLGSVEGFQATKLYCWYDRPWWRAGPDCPDRHPVDHRPLEPHALLLRRGPRRTGRDARCLQRPPARRTPRGPGRRRLRRRPCPGPLLDEITRNLRAIHPGADVPTSERLGVHALGLRPARDRLDVLAGRLQLGRGDGGRPPARSDVPIHVCGETFSRAQAWVEGALATAHAVGDLLLEERRATDA